MATIRDVAKLAEVSVATVSRVLNKSGYVNIETEKKVLQAIKILNFQPNAIARSLNNKQTNTIALIVPDITNPFFPELARAVEDIAQKDGYTVILCNSDEKIEKEKSYIQILQKKYIDGFILASNTFQYNEIDEKIPIVVLDRSLNENIATVVSKNREGARQATTHLLEIGCQKIAHIEGPALAWTARERLQGYLDVIKDAEWFSSDLIIPGNFDMEMAKRNTLQLLTNHPNVDGIFAGNDLMAVGALKGIRQLGKRVPEDVALMGFDNITLASVVEPELSTIAQPIYEMGALATRLLIQKIENQELEQLYHELDVVMIKRASTSREVRSDSR